MQWIKNNYTITISTVIACLLLFYAYGCEPKTQSLIDPARKVTRAEISTEIEFLIQHSELAYADLQRQEQIRDIVFQQGLLAVQGGTLNPVGILTTVMAVLGIGAVGDDFRLRRKIQKGTVYDNA